MSEPETITLPKSGLVLTKLGWLWNYADFRAFVAGLQVRIYQSTDHAWCASTMGGGYTGHRTIDDAISALDAEVLALRAALMPSDARERIAKASWDFDRVCDWSEADAVESEAYYAHADNILAALGIGGDE